MCVETSFTLHVALPVSYSTCVCLFVLELKIFIVTYGLSSVCGGGMEKMKARASRSSRWVAVIRNSCVDSSHVDGRHLACSNPTIILVVRDL